MSAKKMTIGALLVCVSMAACGGGADPSPASPGPTSNDAVPPTAAPRSVVTRGEFELAGAVKVSGDYDVSYEIANENTESCAKIAETEEVGYVVPLPTFKGDYRFTWTAAVRNYNGPGTYDLADLGVVKAQITKSEGADPVEYSSATNGATAKLVVRKNNAGSFEFKDLKSENGDTLSGEASWKCEEGSEPSD